MEHKRILSISDLSKIVHDIEEGKEISTEVLYQACISTKEMQRKIKSKIQQCSAREQALLKAIEQSEGK